MFTLEQTKGRAIKPAWHFDNKDKALLIQKYNAKYQTSHTDEKSIINEIYSQAVGHVAENVQDNIINKYQPQEQEKTAKLISDSALCIVLARCGYITDGLFDFSAIVNAVPDGLLLAMAETASEIARETLWEIEHALRRKDYEYQRRNEKQNTERAGNVLERRAAEISSTIHNETTPNAEGLRTGVRTGPRNIDLLSHSERAQAESGTELNGAESNRQTGGAGQHSAGYGEYERIDGQNIRGDSSESRQQGGGTAGNPDKEQSLEGELAGELHDADRHREGMPVRGQSADGRIAEGADRGNNEGSENLRVGKLAASGITENKQTAESEQTTAVSSYSSSDGQQLLFQPELTKKQQAELEKLTADLEKEYARWKEIRINGAFERFYDDGMSLYLVRNHIIYDKGQLAELFPNHLPEAYNRPLPPEMPKDYHALKVTDEILYKDVKYQVMDIISEKSGTSITVKLMELTGEAGENLTEVSLFDMSNGRMLNLTNLSELEEIEKSEQNTENKINFIVTITQSEHPDITDGISMSFAEANRLFAELDERQRAEREAPDYEGSWYCKTWFKIEGTANGETYNYEGRYDIGDGDGTLLEHIVSYNRYMLDNDGMKAYIKTTDNYEEAIAELERNRDYFIPALQELVAEEKSDFALQLETEAAKSEILTENLITGPSATSYDDAFFVNPESESVCWIYYNPDSSAGGQYVFNYFDYDDIKETAALHNEPAAFFDYIGVICRQELADIGSESFESADEEFRKTPTYTECTAETMKALIELTTENELDFSEQVDKSLAGELPFYTSLKVCDTPQILVDVGCEQLPMLYTQKHLKNAVNPNSDKEHFHGLDVDQIKKLPELLQNPVMIYDSLSRDDSIVVLTSEHDKNNNPIIVSIKPNGEGRYELETIESNFITSVHGRENFTAQLKNAQEQDKILFCNKQKSQEMFERWGLQLSELTNTLDFDIIIHQSRNIVKKNTENEIKKDKSDTVSQLQKNYRYIPGQYSTGAKAKYNDNVEAIRTLKSIEREKRNATPEEQKTLARYVGWGGISKAFDSTDKSWEKEYHQLKGLLNEQEYMAAMESTLTAYYTDPELLIKPIYDTLRRFGFNGGEILDPAAGTGNFFSVIPDDMAAKSNLYGIEIDNLTGRIAKQLYPTANWQLKGYQYTTFEDNTFDVVIGNVPFADRKIPDLRYEDEYYIHDYFFVRALDMTKPGGIVAFITSSGTLDKFTNDARLEMAKRAELIGAVRLPTNTFKSIAGTEVTTDIIFLKKSEKENTDEPKWTGRAEPLYINNSYQASVNPYFVQHPEMIVGKLSMESGPHGPRCMCKLEEGENFAQRLEQALSHLECQFSAEPTIISAEDVEDIDTELEDAPENAKDYRFYVDEKSDVYYVENRKLNPCSFSSEKLNRIRGMVTISERLQKVIDIQLTVYNESTLSQAQEDLNREYDLFVKKYGYLNAKVNANLFRDDLRSPLLLSIEQEIEDKENEYQKADIFTKATVCTSKDVDHADTPIDALYVCLNQRNRVDIRYISQLCGKEPDEVIEQLGNKIYLNPLNYNGDKYEGWELAEQYLSGETRAKLHAAKAYATDNDMFKRNVDALLDNQPDYVNIGDIDFRIGTPFIPAEMYRDFIYDVLGTPQYHRATMSFNRHQRNAVDIAYNDVLNRWFVSGKTLDTNNVRAEETLGTKRINAYAIMEQTLNLQRVEVRDAVSSSTPDGKTTTTYVLNKTETIMARDRQDKLQTAFRNWVLEDPVRSEKIEKIYNDKINVYKTRTYDGSYIEINGLNPAIQLRPHQKNAIARIAQDGTAMLAHGVGAGKTLAMAGAGMYLRQIGMAKKPMYAVPKPIVSQWAREFMRYFPTAKILVATEDDFSKQNRRRFLGKIATGDFDAVVLGHTQFEKLPLSLERQRTMYEDKINHITQCISEMKEAKGERFSVKQMVSQRIKLMEKLDKLTETFRKDDFITFEELGCDFLFVDEAHAFKNLALFTKMTRVAGINSGSESQRATDMEMKTRYIQEINGGRGVVYATGTPISNSVSELFVFQHYLQPQVLRKAGMDYFDNWAGTYGQTVTELEVKPSGSGYQMRTRFAKFNNLPELQKQFLQVFDMVNTADLDLKLPIIANGKPELIACEKSTDQELQVEDGLKRAEAIESGKVSPKDDNMLAICTYMTKVALDPRIVDPNAADEQCTKVNQCVSKILEVEKEYPGSAQVVFCDTNTPKNDGSFSVYNSMRDKLVASGCFTKEQVAFIHEYDSDAKRNRLFAAVNKGDVKVVMGSTSKLGTGVNIQTKLKAAQHLDAPYRPADLEQRNGRIVRQGNLNDEVKIYYYSTKGTFDSYRWQLLEKKQRFISQFLSGSKVGRSCEDIDEATLNYSEMKAATAENPLIAEKMTLDNEVARLQLLKNEWANKRARLKHDVESYYPEEIKRIELRCENAKKDTELLEKTKGQDFSITIAGTTYTERNEAGEMFAQQFEKYFASKARQEGEPSETVATFRGMEVSFHVVGFTSVVRLKGSLLHSCDYSTASVGMMVRIENLAKYAEKYLPIAEEDLRKCKENFKSAQEEYLKPFEHDEELTKQLERQSQINAQLEFGDAEDALTTDDELEM